MKSTAQPAARKSNNAFTLVETIISISIISIVLAASTSLVINLVNANRTAITFMQAHLLAREGIEAVRNMRDSNVRQNLPFDGGRELFSENLSEGTYIIEPVFTFLKTPWRIAKIKLPEQKSAGILYVHKKDGGARYTHFPTGKQTQFARFITIKKDGVKTRLIVESRVLYGTRGEDVVLQTHLTDWQ